MSKFNSSKNTVTQHYEESIINISSCMETRFSNLVVSPVFNNLVHLLDTSMWPTENVAMFGEKKIIELSQHFEVLLQNGKCDLTKILDEWEILKTYIISMVINNKYLGYLEIWKRIFTHHKMKGECMNVLHVFKILLRAIAYSMYLG